MSFLRIIFLLMLFIDGVYPADGEAVEKVAAAVDDVPAGEDVIAEGEVEEVPAPLNWAARHADIVAMSWHIHFLQQFRHMETVGAEALTPAERFHVLEKFSRGHRNNDTALHTPNGSAVRNLAEHFLENQIMGLNLTNFVESGFMPKFPMVGEGRPFRDRRLNAGLVLTGYCAPTTLNNPSL